MPYPYPIEPTELDDEEGRCPYCGALVDEECAPDCDADDYEDEAF